MTTLEAIHHDKIIAILRGLTLIQARETVQAVLDGGLHLVEITFSQTQPPHDTADILSTLQKEFDGRVVFGAGTVMTLAQLHAAYHAGARYIISPNTNIAVIAETKRLGLVSMPGAFTATEIVECHDAGADIVKVFPSDSVGAAYFKALRGPLAHIPLAAVGGVTLDNIRAFFDAGVCCVGIGSNIADKSAIAKGDFAAIRKLARAYADSII